MSACSQDAAEQGNLSPDAGTSEDAAAAVCTPVPPIACPDPPPHFADVDPIIQNRCAACHNDQPDAAWPLQTYEEVAQWADVVKGDLLRCTMPPADGGISMTEDERQAVLAWTSCGALE